MADDKLIFSQEDADRIFTELAELQVDLDNDPLSFGPKRLNSKVSDVRRMLSRCERIYLDVSQRLQTTRRALRIAEAELDISKKHLFANDPETRAGRSVSDREAIAGGKLIKETRTANDLKVTVSDLEAVLIVVKAKRGDLKDAEGRLRDQVRLCQEEIGLGGRWGSARPSTKIDLNQGVATGADVKMLEELLADVDGEIHLQQLSGAFPTEEEAVAGGRDPDPEPQRTPTPVPEPVDLSRGQAQKDLEQSEDQHLAEILSQVAAPVLEPEVVPIQEGALPGTASSDAVESFLEEPLMPAEAPKTRIQKAMQEAADLDIDNLLAEFESNE
jgi:hypothetical protein